ncbi:hypothetical protein HOC13_03355 [Candidatus Woesearchaeota archaeon]|mgnify:FL=1|jgi:protein-tyrosine-phosphatase|nr:hypothetical protein [Candidatus Woesearchaeota archaeon]
MYDMLFICAANVGRSQMAEGFYNYYTKGENAISGAAIPLTEERVADFYKHRPAKEISEVMKERDIEISGQLIKTVTEEMFQNVEKVIVLEKEEILKESKDPYTHTVLHYINGHSCVEYHSIEDPCKGKPEERSREDNLIKFRFARDQIEQIVLDLIEER